MLLGDFVIVPSIISQIFNLISTFMNRKLRMGMVGGGNDAFIGAIHRAAAFMDNKIELVCGCFSIDRKISLQSGKDYFVEEGRIYNSYMEMIDAEAALPEGERMDFVTIVTPNILHFAPAKMALEYGFDVVVEKPMTFNVEEAFQLAQIVERTGRQLCLTHTYMGYPAVKQAREMVASGMFGATRKIFVEYLQGWLNERIEVLGGNNAGWRTDPKRSGKGGCMGDIATHAIHLAEYISSLKCLSLCADLNTYVEGRMIDDDGAALLRFEKGASGVLMASQIAVGEENGLRIRIYGEKGGIEWIQQEPNTLYVKWSGSPTEIYRVGNGYMGDASKANSRTPGGHPEGYIEAFANIYRNFALTLMSLKDGDEPRREWLDFPRVTDGIHVMQFIDTVVESGSNDTQKWFDF